MEEYYTRSTEDTNVIARTYLIFHTAGFRQVRRKSVIRKNLCPTVIDRESSARYGIASMSLFHINARARVHTHTFTAKGSVHPRNRESNNIRETWAALLTLFREWRDDTRMSDIRLVDLFPL